MPSAVSATVTSLVTAVKSIVSKPSPVPPSEIVSVPQLFRLRTYVSSPLSPVRVSSPAPPVILLSSSLPVMVSFPEVPTTFSKSFTAESVTVSPESIVCAEIFERSNVIPDVFAETFTVSTPPPVSSRKTLPAAFDAKT